MNPTADKSGTCPVCNQPVRLRTQHDGYGHADEATARACLQIRVPGWAGTQSPRSTP